MPFTLRNLSVLAYAQGFTLWHYASKADPLAAVAADGFFDDADSMLTTGDMMLISAPDGGRASVVAGGAAGQGGKLCTVPFG